MLGNGNLFLIFAGLLLLSSCSHRATRAPAASRDLCTILEGTDWGALDTQETISRLEQLLADPLSIYVFYFSDSGWKQSLSSIRKRAGASGDRYSEVYANLLRRASNRRCAAAFWAVIHNVAVKLSNGTSGNSFADTLPERNAMLKECIEWREHLAGKKVYQNHRDAIDMFFEYERPTLLKGPVARAATAGLVIMATNGWKGNETASGYQGGGTVPERGNAIIIYDPFLREFSYFGHMYSSSVKPGQFVAAGNAIGISGATGMNAWPAPGKHESDKHIHFEIHSISNRGVNDGKSTPDKRPWIDEICRRYGML